MENKFFRLLRPNTTHRVNILVRNNMKRVSIHLEFIFRASPTILYQFLTTPACLTRWFCDGADIEQDMYTFTWHGNAEVAELVDDIEDERLRFHWVDAPFNEYLEFKMYKSQVTDETVLEITDFANEDEVDDQELFWESQIKILRQETGG